MSKITVVNIKDKQEPNTYRKYCGRPGKGQLGYLGNPFPANSNHSNRDEVCDKLQVLVDKTIFVKGDIEKLINLTGSKDLAFKANRIYHELQDLLKIAKEGRDIELACFCKQKNKEVRCHCDSYKKYLDSELSSTPIILLKDKPFKILVTGGRDFNDYERLEKDILSIVKTKDIKNLILISGMLKEQIV